MNFCTDCGDAYPDDELHTDDDGTLCCDCWSAASAANDMPPCDCWE